MRLVGALTVIAAAGVLTAGAGGSVKAHIACGAVVTTNVMLDANLNCTDDGLIVGANNIKIDLNGFTIEGDDDAGDYGIDNTGGFDNVRIMNGTITDFDRGIFLNGGATKNRIANVIVRSAADDGIVLGDADFASVQKASIFDPADDGIRNVTADGVSLTNNRIVRTGGQGIALNRGAAVMGNTISGTAGSGIDIDGAGNRVTGNTIYAPVGHGIFADGDENRITGNMIEHPGGDGIRLSGDDGSAVEANRVTGAVGHGIAIVNGSDDFVLGRNKLIGNDSNGIFLDNGSGLIESNTANGNRSHGVEVGDPDVTLRKNVAKWNRGQGIVATAGTTDGGGNKAKDNGQLPQCVNVVCS